MACNDCPFMKSSPLVGSPEWLTDVMRFHDKDQFFRHTCHKTDPNADGYAGGKEVRECKGHIQLMLNDIDGTPGKGGVYDSIVEMVERYLRHWLGDAKFEEMRAEARNKKWFGRK